MSIAVRAPAPAPASPTMTVASAEMIGLDALRGFAALLVLFSHARHFVFEDYGAGDRSPLRTAFYAITGLGHQAVIVFFVLSGFLISRSIVRAQESGSWDWRVYLANRLARLWTVLIPCLMLTLALDMTTMALGRSAFYGGDLTFYNSGPAPGGVDLSPATLLGNALFLQTIFVPVFGSNGPLWSLANEFWYYVAFPLIYVLAPRRFRETALVVSATTAVAVGAQTQSQILLLWPAWLLGYYAFRLSRRIADQPWLRVFGTGGVVATLAFTVLAAAAASRAPGLVADLALALALAPAVAVLARLRVTNGLTVAASSWSARISYSLYLSHFPLLAAASALWLGNQRTTLGWAGVQEFGALCLAAIAVAYFVYQLVEQHTAFVKRSLYAAFNIRLSRQVGEY